MDRKKRSFESRTSVTNHPLARKLFEIMSAKKTNLCVAADVTTSKELISLAEKVSCKSLHGGSIYLHLFVCLFVILLSN